MQKIKRLCDILTILKEEEKIQKNILVKNQNKYKFCDKKHL